MGPEVRGGGVLSGTLGCRGSSLKSGLKPGARPFFVTDTLRELFMLAAISNGLPCALVDDTVPAEPDMAVLVSVFAIRHHH